MKQKPFIQLLKTPYTYAFYDVNTNSLVSTNKDVYDKLDVILKAPEEKVDSLMDDPDLQNLLENGYLLAKRPSEIYHPFTDMVEPLMQTKISHIILQVTQNCNFRCAYCAYTNPEEGRQRVHNKKSMDLATAKKALHFLHRHSSNAESISIGLYGGEPLLNFDLIKEMVYYAEEVFALKPIRFSMTTNGSIFTDDIVQFFIDHSFNITVSLDGNRETHNRNRKLASSGEGTFDLVMNKLKWLKDNYPQFAKKCRINMVLDSTADYDCYNMVFTDYDAVDKNNTAVNFIETDLIGQGYEMDERFWVKYQYDLFLGLMGRLGHVQRNSLPPIATSSTNRLDLTMEYLADNTPLGDITAPGGPCVPGLSRLFVDIYGNLYPCERASETSQVMHIGTLDDGFDFDKVKSLLNVGAITKEKCMNCWAIRHCTICVARVEDGNTMSAQKKLARCQTAINNFRAALIDILCLRDGELIMREARKS